MGAGLVFAVVLDRSGGGVEVDAAGVEAWRPEDGLLWVHLDYRDPWSLGWLTAESGLDESVREALVASETRPRAAVVGSGLLLNMRGVNRNPGAEPDDMIALRLWIDERRVITLRHRRLLAAQDVRATLATQAAPKDAGGFLVEIADRVVERISECVESIDDQVDELEEQMVSGESRELRTVIGNLRRQAIRMRRYLAPQRDVMQRLVGESLPWLGDGHRARLRELADRTARCVEDLDEAREHASVAQEELASRMAEQMNRTMYVLSLVAAVFLPLGLLTGLLGINVGGIPGSEDASAFWIVCGFLTALAIFEIWIFRRMRWL